MRSSHLQDPTRLQIVNPKSPSRVPSEHQVQSSQSTKHAPPAIPFQQSEAQLVHHGKSAGHLVGRSYLAYIPMRSTSRGELTSFPIFPVLVTDRVIFRVEDINATVRLCDRDDDGGIV